MDRRINDAPAMQVSTATGIVMSMRGFLRLAVVTGLVVGATVLVRRLLAERAPRHGLNGAGSVAGSLDTWPPVPANPAGAGRG